MGTWPSPYRSLWQPNNDNNYPAHHAHMIMVGASLEKFASDVLVPALIWRKPHQQTEQEQANKTNNLDALLKEATKIRIMERVKQ